MKSLSRTIVAVLISILVAYTGVSMAVPAAAAPPTTGTVHGTLTFPDGSLIPGGVSTDSDSYFVSLVDTVGTTRFGTYQSPDGSYSITGVAPGAYAVLFYYSGHKGYPDMYWGGAFQFRADLPRVVVTAGGDAQVDEHLVDPGSVAGTATGKSGPIDGLGVSVSPVGSDGSGMNYPPSPVVHDDGSFSIGPLAPGAYSVSFGGSNRWLGTSRTVTVSSGSTTDIDIVLDGAARIHATVTVDEGDGTRSPYTGAVDLMWEGKLPSLPIPVAPTAPGTFDFWQGDGSTPLRLMIPEDRVNHIVGAFWDGAADYDSSPAFTSGPNQVTQTTAVAVRGGTITGRVGLTPSSGAMPVFGGAGVDVYVYHQTPAGALEPIAPVDPGGSAFPLGYGMWNEQTGAFTTPVLAPGTYTLYFVPGDTSYGSEFFKDARYFAERTDVVVKAGATAALGDQILRPRYFDVARLAGATRWDTAVAVSKTLYPDAKTAPGVYLASGENFPDALSAGPAAIREGAPLLITGRDHLPAVVAAELVRLGPPRVTIVGGPGAVSAAVEQQIHSLLPSSTVTRLAGATRWETSNAIVRKSFGAKGARVAFIVTGRNFPDALAAGPAAGAMDAPLVLVDGGAKTLSATTRTLLADLGVTDVRIVGGTGVVTSSIESQLVSILGSAHVKRLAGATRWATAAAVDDAVFPGQEQALIANGNGFADALTGAPLAGAVGGPLYLASTSCIPTAAAAGIWNGGTVGLWLIGGTGVLDQHVSRLEVCGY